VDRFVRDFDHEYDTFISRGLGQEMTNDVISSTNTDYVMAKIRERFLSDSTVTIVLMGRCTWARRYVDWEIQSSLRRGEYRTPNGLLGIRLPTFTQFPPRFNANLLAPGQEGDCYARYIEYPNSTEALVRAIEHAYERRTTHAHWIKNARDRMSYNRTCP
jgi:hypothetical protein